MHLYFVDINPEQFENITLVSINYLNNSSKVVYIEEKFENLISYLNLNHKAIKVTNKDDFFDLLYQNDKEDFCFLSSENSITFIKNNKIPEKYCIFISSDLTFIPDLQKMGIERNVNESFIFTDNLNLFINSSNELKILLVNSKDVLDKIDNNNYVFIDDNNFIFNINNSEEINFPLFVFEKKLFQKRLSWLEKLPLYKKNIVVTRPKLQSNETIEKLKILGAKIINFPTIEIVPINKNLLIEKVNNINKYDWIRFTSVNGVEIFFKAFFDSNLDLRNLFGIKLAVIGSKTSEKLYSYGLKSDLIPEKYVAESLIDAFSKISIENKNILLPRAKLARDILPVKLNEMGAIVDSIDTYDTIRPQNNKIELINKLKNKEVDYLTFTSSSTVSNFSEFVKENNLQEYIKDIKVACIGPVTSETAIKTLNINSPLISNIYTVEGLINTILKDIKT